MSSIFDDSDFDNFGIKDAPSKAKTTYQKINYLGGSKQKWPLRLRLLLNPHQPAERKHFHKTITHSKNFNGRWIMTNCPRTVSNPCPMCDKYYDMISDIKALKSSGATEAEIKVLDKKAASYKPKKSISVLAVESGSTEIKLYNMSPRLAEQVFGKDGIRGALEEFKEIGVKWYSPTETMGWLEIQRTGEGFETEYRAEAWMVVNKATRAKGYVEEALSPEVVENMNDPVNMYRIHENFVKSIWSYEELVGYVNSGLSVLPERIAKMYKIDQSFKSKPIGDDLLDSVVVQRPATVTPQRPTQAAPVKSPAKPEPKSAFDLDDIPF
jgi:hypothetical protein